MHNATNQILLLMMTSLKDIRKVTNLHILGNLAVRFHMGDMQYDVRGQYPLLSVHEVEGSMLAWSESAREIEKQLNGGPIIEHEEDPHLDNPAFQDMLCTHVDTMSDKDVQAYSENCGGPDLDTLQSQRTWLKAHFLHLSYNREELLDTVLMIEGKDRKAALSRSIKQHITKV